MNPGPSAYKADALPLSYSGAREQVLIGKWSIGIPNVEFIHSSSSDVSKVNAFNVEALLAQWLERAAVNRKVTGSIPVRSVSSCHLFGGLYGREKQLRHQDGTVSEWSRSRT